MTRESFLRERSACREDGTIGTYYHRYIPTYGAGGVSEAVELQQLPPPKILASPCDRQEQEV
jgi:hypothetical protein